MYIMSPAQKRWGIVVFILSLIGSFLELAGVAIVYPVIQGMIDPISLRNIVWIDRICEVLRINSAERIFRLTIVSVIAIYIIKNVYLFFLSWMRSKYSMKIRRELSLRMMRSYLSRGYNYFRTHNISILLRGIGSSVQGINTILYQFFRLILDILTIASILTFILLTDFKMAIIIALLCGMCLLMVIMVFRKMIVKAGKEAYRYNALANQWLIQLFNGIKEVLVMDRKKYFADNYENAYIKVQKASIKQNISTESPGFIIEGVCVTGIILAVAIRVLGMGNPSKFIPQLGVLAMSAFRVLPSIGKISSEFNSIIFSMPSVNEAYENMKEANRYEEQHGQLSTLESIEGKTDIDTFRFEKGLFVEDVYYKYPDGDENVLDGINICINKGTSVAFVGPSGAGKSTLADIVLGLLEPQKGCIKVDNLKVLENKNIWSRIIGFVPQQPYLIDDTVRRNVAFGIADKDIDDDKIWTALKKAQMEEFVKKHPNGLDTMVGDRGMRFSGGQAQRLVIARALYNDPQILVLDEATSALDTETETAVMEAIDALQGQITMIIIAHRLTTIRNCDVIYEIKDGKARERLYSDLVKE